MALAKSFDVQCEALVFENAGPEVHARRRFAADPRGHEYEYWSKVATVHNANWEFPSLLEGFDAIHHISFEDIKAGKVLM